MAQKQQSEPICSLLDLPNDTIRTIISNLARIERSSIMAACWRLFRMVMMLESSDVKLKISRCSKFHAIKKVLDFCPAQLHLLIMYPSSHPPFDQKAPSTLVMILGMAPNSYLSEMAATCRWECVTKVTIKGASIRCLVPSFLATACPQLAQLRVRQATTDTSHAGTLFTNNPGDTLPLSLCNSLRQLEFQTDIDSEDNEFQLPPSFHSAAQLQHSLPNIDTLVMTIPNLVLLDAFPTQLTRLEITETRGCAAVIQQSIQLCSKLQHLRVDGMFLPDNPAALRVLKIPEYTCSESDIRMLLELPNLTTLHANASEIIKQDWSGHECSWQELHLEGVQDFIALANFSFSSLQKLSIGLDRDFPVIQLPDPSNPSSIVAVQRAADKLAHVGKVLVVTGPPDASIHFGECAALRWSVPEPGSDHEQAAAQMLSIAAQRVGPVSICNVEYLMHRPLLLDVVMNWGQPFLESACFGDHYDMQRDVCQVLKQYHRLDTVVFWRDQFMNDETRDQEMKNITMVVCSVAKHYVIPTNKRLRMEFAVYAAYCGDEDFAVSGKQSLSSEIRQSLPAGSELVSIELCLQQNNRQFSSYGGVCPFDAFWVIAVAPSS